MAPPEYHATNGSTVSEIQEPSTKNQNLHQDGDVSASLASLLRVKKLSANAVLPYRASDHTMFKSSLLVTGASHLQWKKRTLAPHLNQHVRAQTLPLPRWHCVTRFGTRYCHVSFFRCHMEGAINGGSLPSRFFEGACHGRETTTVPTRKHTLLGTETKRKCKPSCLLKSVSKSTKTLRTNFISQLQKIIFQERYEVEDDAHHFGRFQARESNQNNKKQTEAETKTKSKRKSTFFDQLQSRKAKFDSGVSSGSTLVNDAKKSKVKATKNAIKPAKPNNKKKDQGHDFRCIPKTVWCVFDGCLKHNLAKKALVEEMGFGHLSNLPKFNLKQKVLKELVKCFDIYDNTIHSVAGDVEITTEKISKVLGLCWRGDAFEKKVVQKDLSDEDYNVFKFFQGSTQAALTRLIYETPVDTAENKLLFKRAFLIFIQKCFLLATLSPNVTPRSLPTLFDIENTRGRNWAPYVHDFLLEEVEKAKVNNTKSIHGCCYAMLIIYFHETHFGKNPSAEEAQPPWIQYWRGSKLKKRMKQEETNSAISILTFGSGCEIIPGLLKTGRLKFEKERLMKKNAKKNHASESESESDWESDEDEFESSGSYQELNSKGTISDKLRQRTRRLPNQNPAQQERRSKKKHESIATQGSSISGVLGSENRPLARTFDRIKKRKQKDNKQTLRDETIASPNARSDNSNEPSPIKVLVPKAEKIQLSPNEDQPPNVVCLPSQPIVDGMPVYPSQEVYDISSSSEYEQPPPLIPKEEKVDEHDDIPCFDLGQP
ncbi:hypothetical protein PIB30_010137 [Stylosanthes scabra]|uniref:Aminotransferase-like plant mobile domain-containing protein n=1 Tax=Stylosanthes scabra TaxID=79078 RepID=A0ABU6Z432_9FABA|nr:hypothetical protein [Stylosanthes scabra]